VDKKSEISLGFLLLIKFINKSKIYIENNN